LPTQPLRWPYKVNGVRAEAILEASKIKRLAQVPLELNSPLDPIDMVRRFGQIIQTADHIINSLSAVSPDEDAQRLDTKRASE
jgi:hypothetical protein